MTTKDIIEIILGFIAMVLGVNWIIKKNIQKVSQKQKSGGNSVNIAISNNFNKEE